MESPSEARRPNRSTGKPMNGLNKAVAEGLSVATVLQRDTKSFPLFLLKSDKGN